MRIAWGFAILAATAIGCGRNPTPAPHTPSSSPEAPQSTVSTVINGITGKAAVEAGKKARDQITVIGKQEQRDVNEAMQP